MSQTCFGVWDMTLVHCREPPHWMYTTLQVSYGCASILYHEKEWISLHGIRLQKSQCAHNQKQISTPLNL